MHGIDEKLTFHPLRIAVLVVSDTRTEETDKSGALLVERIGSSGHSLAGRTIVPDDIDAIQAQVAAWADDPGVDVIVATGGTGFAPRDVTPEATRAVIEREAPGLAEAMRAASLQATAHAMLSRAVCGIRGRTLIVNLPGSPKAVRENLATISPALPHAVQLLQGSSSAEAGHRSA